MLCYYRKVKTDYLYSACFSADLLKMNVLSIKTSTTSDSAESELISLFARSSGLIKDLVQDSLKGGRCIGDTIRGNPELVVAVGSPESSLDSVRFLQENFMEAKSCIQTCEVRGALQLIKQNINIRQWNRDSDRT